jgi:uncharacterized LabA/DUF88 family protein
MLTDSMKPSCAIFVDVQNIYYTTRQAHNAHFDYRKLWALISAENTIVTANAYAIDRGDERQRSFQSTLKSIGFAVKLKQFIQRSDGSAKGDWDVGIAIDVMQEAQQVDKVILLSGDGDFDLLLDRVKKDYAVTTEVYGVQALTADSLINSADVFNAIDEELLLKK